MSRLSRFLHRGLTPGNLVIVAAPAIRRGRLSSITRIIVVADYKARAVVLVLVGYSRGIARWRAATSMATDLPLDALEMAIWACNDRLVDVACSVGTTRYTERLVAASSYYTQEQSDAVAKTIPS